MISSFSSSFNKKYLDMTNNADLYDLFAKGVRSFDSTEASVIADTFADLTYAREE